MDSRIYVACLAAYNNGILHGAWIDAGQDADVIFSDIQYMLAVSPIPHAEEFAIHDYEGFGGLPVSEYANIRRIAAVADMMAHYPKVVVAAYVNDIEDVDVDTLNDDFHEAYEGAFTSLEEWAEEAFKDQLNKVPESIRPFVDVRRIANDAELSGDIWTHDEDFQTIHVFRVV